MHRRLCLFALLTAITLTGPVLAAGAPAAQATSSRSPTSVAAYLVDRINAARADRGLAPLRVRQDLSDYARAHSASMAGGRTLFHTADFRVICCWSAISENVAYNRTARGAHRSLMASPAHRANILDPGKRAVGVGVVRAYGVYWVTQVFRRPR